MLKSFILFVIIFKMIIWIGVCLIPPFYVVRVSTQPIKLISSSDIKHWGRNPGIFFSYSELSLLKVFRIFESVFLTFHLFYYIFLLYYNLSIRWNWVTSSQADLTFVFYWNNKLCNRIKFFNHESTRDKMLSTLSKFAGYCETINANTTK